MKLVADLTKRRPGCSLLQATLGGDLGIEDMFDSKEWIIAPTPDLRCYEISEEQLARFVAEVNACKPS